MCFYSLVMLPVVTNTSSLTLPSSMISWRVSTPSNRSTRPGRSKSGSANVSPSRKGSRSPLQGSSSVEIEENKQNYRQHDNNSQIIRAK